MEGPAPTRRPSRQRGSSLVLASLELGRELAARDALSFRARGMCMYPVVRGGDVLRVAARTAAEVAVGDIAVCRGDGFLFAHRVIATGCEAGRPYVVTRPDRATRGDDGPTFDEDLLGVVSKVERRGQPVSFGPQTPPPLVRAYYDSCAAAMSAGVRAAYALVNALGRLQESVLYRPVAWWWSRAAHRRVSYAVRLPMRHTGDGIYHELPADGFDAAMVWQGRPVERWVLVLRLDEGQPPAAWVTLVRAGPDAWRVEASEVRLRYRGLGLEEALVCEAEVILTRAGMTPAPLRL